jgi:hypothetical protein
VDNTDYFKWILAQMRKYMLHIIQKKGFKPTYYNYNPSIGLVVTADHVARFYGCHMARMLQCFPSIPETWSTQEPLDAIGPVNESMPHDAYTFLDDWSDEDDEDWDNIYEDAKFEPLPEVERHRKKYEHIEDGYNKRWKECVIFGRWITAEKSRLAG